MKISHASSKVGPGTASLKRARKGHFTRNLVAKMLKPISVVPSTEAIDSMAIWMYLFLFVAFNYIYWRSHVNQSTKID